MDSSVYVETPINKYIKNASQVDDNTTFFRRNQPKQQLQNDSSYPIEFSPSSMQRMADANIPPPPIAKQDPNRIRTTITPVPSIIYANQPNMNLNGTEWSDDIVPSCSNRSLGISSPSKPPSHVQRRQMIPVSMDSQIDYPAINLVENITITHQDGGGSQSSCNSMFPTTLPPTCRVPYIPTPTSTPTTPPYIPTITTTPSPTEQAPQFYKLRKVKKPKDELIRKVRKVVKKKKVHEEMPEESYVVPTTAAPLPSYTSLVATPAATIGVIQTNAPTTLPIAPMGVVPTQKYEPSTYNPSLGQQPIGNGVVGGPAYPQVPFVQQQLPAMQSTYPYQMQSVQQPQQMMGSGFYQDPMAFQQQIMQQQMLQQQMDNQQQMQDQRLQQQQMMQQQMAHQQMMQQQMMQQMMQQMKNDSSQYEYSDNSVYWRTNKELDNIQKTLSDLKKNKNNYTVTKITTPPPNGLVASTILTQDARMGETILQLTTPAGVEIGMDVVIDQGEKMEVHKIVNLGSIYLDNPLFYDHPKGTVINIYLPNTVPNIISTPSSLPNCKGYWSYTTCNPSTDIFDQEWVLNNGEIPGINCIINYIPDITRQLPERRCNENYTMTPTSGVTYGITNGVTNRVTSGPFNPSLSSINTPLDVGNCILWLDANDSTSILFDSTNTNITTWKDKSGKSNDLINSSTNYPVLSKNKTSGKNTVDFTNNAYLYNENIIISNSYTVFIVAATNTKPTVNGNILGTFNDGNFHLFTSYTNPLLLGGLANSNPGILLGVFDSNLDYWNGYIAEIIIYNNDLSNTNSAKAVETYLINKWMGGNYIPTPTSNIYTIPTNKI